MTQGNKLSLERIVNTLFAFFFWLAVRETILYKAFFFDTKMDFYTRAAAKQCSKKKFSAVSNHLSSTQKTQLYLCNYSYCSPLFLYGLCKRCFRSPRLSTNWECVRQTLHRSSSKTSAFPEAISSASPAEDSSIR